jgi:hypothetical protein
VVGREVLDLLEVDERVRHTGHGNGVRIRPFGPS